MLSFQLDYIKMPDKTSVYTKHKMYNVYLSSEQNFYFENIKHAKKFLAETNVFLNEFANELNLLIANTLHIYTRLKLMELKADLIRDISDSLNSFMRAYDFKYNNGFYAQTSHPFIYLSKALMFIYHSIKGMYKFCNHERIYTFRNDLEICLITYKRLANNINDWGIKNAPHGSV